MYVRRMGSSGVVESQTGHHATSIRGCKVSCFSRTRAIPVCEALVIFAGSEITNWLPEVHVVKSTGRQVAGTSLLKATLQRSARIVIQASCSTPYTNRKIEAIMLQQLFENCLSVAEKQAIHDITFAGIPCENQSSCAICFIAENAIAAVIRHLQHGSALRSISFMINNAYDCLAFQKQLDHAIGDISAGS